MTPYLLSAEDLVVRYGRSQALFGAGLSIGRGECVTLLGRNGMGKTTTVKAIMGMHPLSGGTVRFDGAEISGRPDFEIARLGIGLVPEGRGIFGNLSVRENLQATAIERGDGRKPWTLARIYELFPRLQERATNLGSDLSGGEQQMLAIGRALLTNPHLLILDEATEGLAPLIRQAIWDCLSQLKSEGLALLLIDKNLRPLMQLGDRHYVLEKGQVAWSGTSADLAANDDVMSRYLSL